MGEVRDLNASTVHCWTACLHACMLARFDHALPRQRRCPAPSPAYHCCLGCLSHANWCALCNCRGGAQQRGSRLTSCKQVSEQHAHSLLLQLLSPKSYQAYAAAKCSQGRGRGHQQGTQRPAARCTVRHAAITVQAPSECSHQLSLPCHTKACLYINLAGQEAVGMLPTSGPVGAGNISHLA